MKLVNQSNDLEKKQARKELLVFLALVAAGSIPLQTIILRSGKQATDQVALVVLLMWVPAIASMITRLVFKEGFGDVSFRIGGRKGWAAVVFALGLPALICFVAYGFAWILGLAQFITPSGGLFAAISQPMLRLIARTAFAITIGAVIGIISAGGEELSWRGYMITRLVKAGIPQPLIVSGLIWGIWHISGILGGIYVSGPYRWLSALLFLGTTTGLSIIWGKMRLETGSVWPAVLGHAAWNQVIEGPFTAFTGGVAAALWIGESGVVVSIITLLAAWLYSIPLAQKKGMSIQQPVPDV